MPCARSGSLDDASDRVPWVEGGERVLEDHLHPGPNRSHRCLAEAGDVFPVEQDTAAGRLDELEDRATERRLSAARLADETDCLTATDRERDAVDRLDVTDMAVENQPALDREPDLEVVQFDERA